MEYYIIQVRDRPVYACTDPHRFIREAARYAEVQNAKLVLPPSSLSSSRRD